LFQGGTLNGNINFHGAQQGATQGPNRVTFKRTRPRKNAQRPAGARVSFDKNRISKLRPHQQKAFYRKFFQAPDAQSQQKEVDFAERLLAQAEAGMTRAQQGWPHQGRAGTRAAAAVASTDRARASTTQTMMPESNIPIGAIEEVDMTETYELTDGQCQTETFEFNPSDPEELALELDKVPREALEYYFQTRLENNFVPKSAFEEVVERLGVLEKNQENSPGIV